MEYVVIRSMALAAGVWIVAFALFVLVLRKRWLARFHHGYLYAVAIALFAMALMASTVIGVLGYRGAKLLLDQQIERGLNDVGEIVERRMEANIAALGTTATSLSQSLRPLIEAKASAAEIQSRLDMARSFNPRYLEFQVFDANMRLVAATSSARRPQPVSKRALGTALDGERFLGNPDKSEAFGTQVLLVVIPLAREAEAAAGALAAWFDVQIDLVDLIASVQFNESGYAVIVDGQGHVIAHPNAERLNQDVSSYPAVQAAWRERKAGSIVAANARGEERLFVYRPVQLSADGKAPADSADRRPWVLLTEINAEEQLAPVHRLRDELALGLAVLLVIGLVIAHQVSWSVQRPLHDLGEFAEEIGAGDLTRRSTIAGHDVAGRLAARLNHMADGLQERDRVKEVFGRYIATQVSDQILKGEVNLGGEARNVTVLFSDIRNFTGMSEQLTPQQVVSFLNDYFSEMVDAVFEYGGVLDKFIGDGLMAVFGSLGNDPDHARHAVHAAVRMKALLAKINGVRAMSGRPPIQIGVGIHTDEVIVGNIGSRKRLEYTVVGDGVNTSSRLQGLNKEFGTTILISETTFEAVKDEFECRQMPEAHLRGKTRDLKFYEVVSLKAAVAAV